MTVDIDKLVRKNIKDLLPYSSARQEYTGSGAVFLDANENAYGSPLAEQFNRYPDPLQWELKGRLAAVRKIPPENIFIGNGSDEAIDLAYRIFCEPGKDNVIICPPTYGMYEVCAGINAVEVRKVLLTEEFELDVEAILAAADNYTKLLFICSPNNPTGNCMKRSSVLRLLQAFNGIMVVDEAYIDLAVQQSFIAELEAYPNLIVMQTLSKAWGLAALRLGTAYASAAIIRLFNKVKPPYNINGASQQLATTALQHVQQVQERVAQVIEQRQWLAEQLSKYPFVKKLYHSDANFILVKVDNADALYRCLIADAVIVRNRSHEPGCTNCLRITVGTPKENQRLLAALNNYNK